MSVRRRGTLALVAVILLASVVGCGSPPASGQSGQPGSPGTAGQEHGAAAGQAAAGSDQPITAGGNSGQRQHLTVALGHGLDYLGLDPFGPGRENTLFAGVVYEPLLLETAQGTLEPALAERWEPNENGTRWTFYLRRGVKFHDGTPFDAHAVDKAFSQYMKDRATKSRLGVKSLEIIDDYTVAFNLERPHAPFLSVVGGFSTVIPSPAALDQSGRLTGPIGTGPFKVKSHSKEQVDLVRFDEHWRGKTALASVRVKYVPDPSTMVMALEAGEVDVIGADGYGIPRNEIKRLAANPELQVVLHKDTSSLEWISFNITKEPLQDRRVREALNYAIDRATITQHVLEGYSTPARGPIGFDASIPWTNTSIQGYAYDPERARQILAEAGWQDQNGDGILEKNQQPLRFTLLLEGSRDWKLVAEAIQTQLKQVGVQMDLQLLDGGVISDRKKSGDWQAAAEGSIGKSAVDPYYFFVYYFTSQGRGSVIRGNEKIDSLVSRSMATIDPTERGKLYNQIQEEIMNVLPGAFLHHPTRATVLRAGVQGWEFSGTMDPLRLLWKVNRG